MSNYINTVRSTIKYWYVPAIIGVLLIALGIYSMTTPLETYVALAIFFSVVFFISGILQIVFAISNKDQIDGWGWQLAAGILYTIVGFYLMIYPQITMATLPFVVGFYVMFHSIYQIAFSVDLNKLKVKNWWAVLIWGILGLILSFLLLINPMVSGLSLVYAISLAIVIAGIASITVAFSLNSVRKKFKNIPEDLRQRTSSLNQEYDQHLK